MRLINVSITLLFITFICKTTAIVHPKHISSAYENKTVYTAIQSTRKTLKKVRKWKTAHKAEVNLVNCVSKYYEYPIPGLGRSDDYQYEYVIVEEDVKPGSEQIRSRRRAETKDGSKGKIINDDELRLNKPSADELSEQETDNEIDTCKLSQIWDSFVLLARFIRDKIYEPFLAPFWRHKLFSCGKDYAVSKFWAWVDAAPE